MGSGTIGMTCPRGLVCRVDGVVMEARVGCMPDAPLNRLLNLKVARWRKGMAPNKPLFVLVILDLVEAGLVGAEGWCITTPSRTCASGPIRRSACLDVVTRSTWGCRSDTWPRMVPYHINRVRPY
jgi:hypothetical protein